MERWFHDHGQALPFPAIVKPFTPAAFAGLLLTCTGCGDKPEEEAKAPVVVEPIKATITEKRSLFNPKPGEEWVYRVTREVPVTSDLSERDALRIVRKHDQFYELAFERKRVCAGLVTVGDAQEELLRIDIFDDGQLVEQEFSEVSAKGLYGRGATSTPGEDPVLVGEGIPIAVPGMEGGHMWRSMGKGNSREFKFRVIDRDKLELPAGTFDVAQIQIDAGSGMKSYQKTLWFAENVGIVKEVTTHFDTASIQVRETSELMAWNLPGKHRILVEENPDTGGPEPASLPGTGL